MNEMLQNSRAQLEAIKEQLYALQNKAGKQEAKQASFHQSSLSPNIIDSYTTVTVGDPSSYMELYERKEQDILNNKR